jgi:hypothetical protein
MMVLSAEDISKGLMGCWRLENCGETTVGIGGFRWLEVLFTLLYREIVCT